MRESPPRRLAPAVAVLFVINGFVFGSWAPRIPQLRDRLDLDVATLGFVLLGAGLGGLIGSLAGGSLVDRIGSRTTAVGGAAALAAVLPLLAVAPSALTLGAVFALVGVLDSSADIAMNAQAVQVQARRQRSVMHRFHAAWSFGMLGGSAVAAVLAGLRVGVGVHFTGVAAITLATVAWCSQHLLSADDARPEARRWGGLSRPALVLAAAAARAAVVEGSSGDWSAVFLTDVHQANPGVAGAGFVAFAVAMAAGRLGGDRVVERLGSRRALRLSVGINTLSLLAVVAAPTAAVSIAGFAGMGLGVAAFFPHLYGLAGSLPTVSAGAGLAAMTAGARVGFLSGPPLVGLVASGGGLRLGLALVVGAGLALTALLAASR